MHDSVPCRGVWGHAPPEHFENLDTQRVLLVHFLTSKSTSVYAYSYLCLNWNLPMDFVTRKLNMHG